MNLKDVCRLLLTTELSNRRVAAAFHISPNTARRYRARLIEEHLSWPQVAVLPDAALESRLNSGRERQRQRFVEPDWSYVHSELRKPGVTISLLYEEYAASTPAGAMSETEYRRRYSRYERSLGIVMRQPRLPGYQLFLDYSGKRPSITNRNTGERRPVELFVAVIGASRRTFAYVTATQRLPDWCEANVKALEFFEGVPTLLVPDNLKSAVDRITKAEGQVINFTFSQLARHYDCVVMPARPYQPRDKAPVEAGVLFAQRWILGRLRNQIFYSLEELNQAISGLLQRMNDKPMQAHQGKSRNQLFDELDRPALKPLPQHPFEYADWKLGVTVPQDYHVVWDDHHYSVPYRNVGSKVRLRATGRLIEIFDRNENFPIATHLRSPVKGGCTTNPEHQPAAHRAYAQDQADELIAWADRSGPSISRFMKAHIDKYRKPMMSLQAFRSVKSLAREHGVERLDAACTRALRLQAIRVSSLRSMLERGIESAPLRGDAANDPMPGHENVRGPATYE